MPRSPTNGRVSVVVLVDIEAWVASRQPPELASIFLDLSCAAGWAMVLEATWQPAYTNWFRRFSDPTLFSRKAEE